MKYILTSMIMLLMLSGCNSENSQASEVESETASQSLRSEIESHPVVDDPIIIQEREDVIEAGGIAS